MLVLTREENQTIVIGDNVIRVTVVRISGKRVRLSIEAPANISVHREEVFDRLQREQGDD